MTRSIVLVDFQWHRPGDPRVPLGHASILAHLRSAGVAVDSLVFAVNEGHPARAIAATILRTVRRLGPHSDIAIGCYVWGEHVVQQVLPLLRSRFDGRIILGGPQVSYCGRGLESAYPAADHFIRGYGEIALARLATEPQGSRIPGVHSAGENDRRQVADVDLAALASPLLSGTLEPNAGGHERWETQRGCPFKCAFCQHKEAGARLKQRSLPLTRLYREIKILCQAAPTRISVLDPIFNGGQHANAVLERFSAAGYSGELSLQCRAESCSEAFVAAAGRLRTTLEFGLQTIHRREGIAVERFNNMDKVERTLTRVQRLGIAHEVSLIYGLPNQTRASFRESVSWCLERRVPVVKAFPLMLLRGTSLARNSARWGLCESQGPMPYVTSSNSFSKDDQRWMQAIAAALQRTERKHPRSFETLERLALKYNLHAAPVAPEVRV